MDIWEDMYNKAKKEYHREDVSPFIVAHHVVAQLKVKMVKFLQAFVLKVLVVL